MLFRGRGFGICDCTIMELRKLIEYSRIQYDYRQDICRFVHFLILIYLFFLAEEKWEHSVKTLRSNKDNFVSHFSPNSGGIAC